MDRNHLKRLIICLAFCGGCARSFAQDPVYSQAFLSPIYLNPAATGGGDYDLRVSAIARRQWWKIPSFMNYVALSVDKFIPEVNGGVGLVATHSSEGYLKKNGIYGTYSYAICSGAKSAAENGGTPRWFLTAGLQFGLGQTNIDYNKLVFADQLDVNGYIPNSVSSVSSLRRSGRLYPDFGAGTFFNWNIMDNWRLLFGFSAHHLNKPDESLTFSGDSIQSRIPTRLTGNFLLTHTNYETNWSYSVGGIVYQQDKNSSVQFGGEIIQNKIDLSLGLWYRGRVNFTQINTFNVSLTFNLQRDPDRRDKVRVGIGHDAEIGQKAYSATAGSSEIGFVWDHGSYRQPDNDPCKPKISSMICP